MEETELTFIRCPSCRSLVPAVATRCRMCGHSLKDDQAVSAPQTSERKGRVRQRTTSVNEESFAEPASEQPEVNGPTQSPIMERAAEAVSASEPVAEPVQPEPAFLEPAPTPPPPPSQPEPPQQAAPAFEEESPFRLGSAARDAAFSAPSWSEQAQASPEAPAAPQAPVAPVAPEAPEAPVEPQAPPASFDPAPVAPAAPAASVEPQRAAPPAPPAPEAPKAPPAPPAQRPSAQVVLEDVSDSADALGDLSANGNGSKHTAAAEQDGEAAPKRKRRRRRRKRKTPGDQPAEQATEHSASNAGEASEAGAASEAHPKAEDAHESRVEEPPPPAAKQKEAKPKAKAKPKPKKAEVPEVDESEASFEEKTMGSPEPVSHAPVERKAPPRRSSSAQKFENPDDGVLLGWFVNFDDDPKGDATEVRTGRYFIGSERIRATDMVVADSSISAPHCVVKASSIDGLKVQDMMSDKGTFVKRAGDKDYTQYEDSVTVEHGDWLRLGDYEVMVCILPLKKK